MIFTGEPVGTLTAGLADEADEPPAAADEPPLSLLLLELQLVTLRASAITPTPSTKWRLSRCGLNMESPFVIWLKASCGVSSISRGVGET
jgi:hypothetical protein